MKLASKYETKLGLPQQVKTADVSLPKGLRKLARAERDLQHKLAQCREEYSKIAKGPTVKYAGGTLPAVYHVCETCQGQGKVATNERIPNVKFASTEEYLSYLAINKCSTCEGNRVVKAVDDSKCDEETLLAYASEKAEKDEKKKAKKGEKLKKKAEKAEKKADEKKMAVEDPEKYAALKAEKKAKKSKKKAEKKAKKAEKKAIKAKGKVANFFGKKD